jgi:hypothetical protein
MPHIIFKLTFANNEVVSCEPAESNSILSELYDYEHQNENLIYALIKADTEAQAIAISHTIVFDLKMKYGKTVV